VRLRAATPPHCAHAALSLAHPSRLRCRPSSAGLPSQPRLRKPSLLGRLNLDLGLDLGQVVAGLGELALGFVRDLASAAERVLGTSSGMGLGGLKVGLGLRGSALGVGLEDVGRGRGILLELGRLSRGGRLGGTPERPALLLSLDGLCLDRVGGLAGLGLGRRDGTGDEVLGGGKLTLGCTEREQDEGRMSASTLQGADRAGSRPTLLSDLTATAERVLATGGSVGLSSIEVSLRFGGDLLGVGLENRGRRLSVLLELAGGLRGRRLGRAPERPALLLSLDSVGLDDVGSLVRLRFGGRDLAGDEVFRDGQLALG
jgi:hypothetical protein